MSTTEKFVREYNSQSWHILNYFAEMRTEDTIEHRKRKIGDDMRYESATCDERQETIASTYYVIRMKRILQKNNFRPSNFYPHASF